MSPQAAAGLALVLGGAAALRFWSLSWGLPLKHAHIDESIVVFYSLRVLAGDPNPQVFFDYPAFFLYVLSTAFRLAVEAASWTGRVENLPAAAEAYLRGDAALFTLAARAVNAVLSVLTVGVVFRMGRRLGNSFIGLTAAGFTAVARLPVLHAHYGTVDTATVLFSVLALDSLLLYWTSGGLRPAVWAAVWIGLGAATKYYPALLGMFLVAAPFVRREARPLRTALSLAAAAVVVFAAASPYSFIAWEKSLGRIFHLAPKLIGSPGGGWPLVETAGHVLRNAWPVLIFAAAGCWDAIRRGTSKDPWKPLAGATALVLVFFGLWSAQIERYTLLVYPPLFLLAARGIWLLNRFHARLPAAAAAVIGLVMLVPTASALKTLSIPDTRLRARSWLNETIPPQSRILRFAHTPEFTASDPYQVIVDWENRLLNAPVGPGAFEGYDFVLYGSYDPSSDPAVEKLASMLSLEKKFDEPEPGFPHHPAVFIYRPPETATENL